MTTMPRYAAAAYLAVFAAGVFLRVFFTLEWHDPRDYVYSDMQIYVQAATATADPNHVLGPADVTHPPATSRLLAWCLRLDPTLRPAVLLQLVVSILTPLAVGALAWAAFGAHAGALATAVSSLYFPFIEYGGFFLAEVHFTPLLAVTFALLLAALGAEGRGARLALAGGAGFAFSLMVSFKVVAIPALATFWLTYLFLGRRERGGVAELAAFAAGALPLLASLARHCTSANGGRFCLAGNKGASDFLLGHYGRIGTMHWTDFHFGNPPSVARGYTATVSFDFSLTDTARNLAAGFGWIREHPLQALVLSIDHVYDTFSGTPAWPGENTSFWPLENLSAYFYLVFLLAPILYAAVATVRRRGAAALAASRELLVFSPLFGLAAAAFVTSGEPRYRQPFDALLIAIVCSLLLRTLERAPRE